MKPFNFLSLSICLILNLSCQDKSKSTDKIIAEEPKQIVAENSSKESPNKEILSEKVKEQNSNTIDKIDPCAALQMSEEPSLAIWKMKNGESLIVCTLAEFDKISEDEMQGWVNIYPNKVSRELGLIKEVDSELSSSQVTFKVKRESDSKVTVTRIIHSFTTDAEQDLDFAITESTIDCSGKICVKNKEICLNKKPNIEIDQKLIEYVENIASGKEKDFERFGYYPSVLIKIGSYALSGNSRAIQIMLKQEQNLRLDGEASHSFDDAQETLKTLIELKCIKP